MILNLFRRNVSETIVERLYDDIVAASRRTAFFEPPFAVSDTLEGRIEMLMLHNILVLRRLSALPPPAPELAQDLANRVFRGFDEALREMGVGDLTVPKRMKTLAGDFGGRSAAFARGLSGSDDLALVLARNVYGSAEAARGAALAAWVRDADHALSRASLEAFEQGLPTLPDPALARSP